MRLSKKQLRGILSLSYKKQNRPNLVGALVHKNFVAVSDGHCMLVAHDRPVEDMGEDLNALRPPVSPQILEAIIAFMGNKDSVEFGREDATIYAEDGYTPSKKFDLEFVDGGRFPPVGEVIPNRFPEGSSSPERAMSPKLASKVFGVLDRCYVGPASVVEVFASGPLDPVRIEMRNNDPYCLFTAVIMPMRMP